LLGKLPILEGTNIGQRGARAEKTFPTITDPENFNHKNHTKLKASRGYRFCRHQATVKKP
jgi:hypothetical protein